VTANKVSHAPLGRFGVLKDLPTCILEHLEQLFLKQSVGSLVIGGLLALVMRVHIRAKKTGLLAEKISNALDSIDNSYFHPGRYPCRLSLDHSYLRTPVYSSIENNTIALLSLTQFDETGLCGVVRRSAKAQLALIITITGGKHVGKQHAVSYAAFLYVSWYTRHFFLS